MCVDNGIFKKNLCNFLNLLIYSKDEIKDYIVSEFGYDLSRTCDVIRPTYHHVESCQGTVPEAITAFLEGTDFEDVIRTAVSIGGDCDTLTCIAGSIAQAFYGIPEEMMMECRKRLPKDMLGVLDRFEQAVHSFHDPFLDGICYEDGREEKLYLTADGRLGTDATNPSWVKSGRAVSCEYGIYPLEYEEMREISKVDQ